MPNVTRKYQNHVVKCEAQNAVGLSADSETLDVICEYWVLLEQTKLHIIFHFY